MLFFEFDSKNWFFLNMTQRIELFLNVIQSFFFQKKKTVSIEHFENMTPRIEPIFLIWLTELKPSFQNDSKNWTLLFNMTQRIESFILFNMTHRIEPFFRLWLIEFEHDSKKWTIFLLRNITQRIEPFLKIWLKELNPFYNMSIWIGFFLNILKELNFFEYDSKIWTFFNVIQIIEPYF